MSRSAYYKGLKHLAKPSKAETVDAKLIALIQRIRRQHPRMGVRKLHYLINHYEGISCGRDYLFSLAKKHNLLVKRKRRRRFVKPGQAQRRHNLLKHTQIQRTDQAWGVDITYIRYANRDAYLSLVVDLFSRKIIAAYLSTSLDTKGSLIALKHAIDTTTSYQGIIHHSDGGIQYTSGAYQNYLRLHGLRCSMTQPASPQQNAIVERINGILKHEYLLNTHFQSFDLAKSAVFKAVILYNRFRPHSSLKLLTPHLVHLHHDTLSNTVNLF